MRGDVRNDLALLYKVHLDPSSPRQIRELRFTPLKRNMHNAWRLSQAQDVSAIQTNLLPRTAGTVDSRGLPVESDWEVLRTKFAERCAAFNVTVETETGSADFVVTM